MRILVVEDEPNILLLYQKLLQEEGHEVITTTDGEECLRQYLLSIQEKRIFDVVILDYRIPKLDGREVAIQILKREPRPDIIMVTAYVKELVEYYSGIENVVTILQKPFELEELTGLLSKIAAEKNKISSP